MQETRTDIMYTLRRSLLAVALLALAWPAAAQTSITTTTLGAAVTTTDATAVTVAANTGITAGSTYLFIVPGNEGMPVTAVSGTAISVQRTGRAVTHNNGDTVYVVPVAATVQVDPSGSCTRGTGAALYTLVFNFTNGNISACRLESGGTLYSWVTTNAALYSPSTPPQTP